MRQQGPRHTHQLPLPVQRQMQLLQQPGVTPSARTRCRRACGPADARCEHESERTQRVKWDQGKREASSSHWLFVTHLRGHPFIHRFPFHLLGLSLLAPLLPLLIGSLTLNLTLLMAIFPRPPTPPPRPIGRPPSTSASRPTALRGWPSRRRRRSSRSRSRCRRLCPRAAIPSRRRRLMSLVLVACLGEVRR